MVFVALGGEDVQAWFTVDALGACRTGRTAPPCVRSGGHGGGETVPGHSVKWMSPDELGDPVGGSNKRSIP